MLHSIYKYNLNKEIDLLKGILIIQILVSRSVVHEVKKRHTLITDCEILCLTALPIMNPVIYDVTARNPAVYFV